MKWMEVQPWAAMLSFEEETIVVVHSFMASVLSVNAVLSAHIQVDEDIGSIASPREGETTSRSRFHSNGNKLTTNSTVRVVPDDLVGVGETTE